MKAPRSPGWFWMEFVFVCWGRRPIFSKEKVPSSHTQASKFKGKPCPVTKEFVRSLSQSSKSSFSESHRHKVEHLKKIVGPRKPCLGAE